MPDKKKKNKKDIKVRDLEPTKDAKGGVRLQTSTHRNVNVSSHQVAGATRQG